MTDRLQQLVSLDDVREIVSEALGDAELADWFWDSLETVLARRALTYDPAPSIARVAASLEHGLQDQEEDHA